jgi:hypothetical protein
MDLQPIVGNPCAHCKERILVDTDGKNCPRCGLAIHRRHAKAHRAECADKPMVARVARDYDEVPPLVFTRRLVALLCTGAFLLAMGLAWLTTAEPEPYAGESVQQPPRPRIAMTWRAIGVGLATLIGGYAYERHRQNARRLSNVSGVSESET